VTAAPDHRPILLRGLLPTGEQVLVTIWDETGAIRAATPGGIAGEVATRYEEGARWGVPSILDEVKGE
jgi:hypothetical protein